MPQITPIGINSIFGTLLGQMLAHNYFYATATTDGGQKGYPQPLSKEGLTKCSALIYFG
jgi:hypothetical protein